MSTKEFNALPLAERADLIFGEGKLIGIYKEYTILKEFNYELNGLQVNVTYNKLEKKLVDIKALGQFPDKRAYRKGA